MEYYYSKTSPYARKGHLILQLTGLISQTQLHLASGFNDEAFRQTNPLGKIPALVDGELTLINSPLICEYLCDQARTTIDLLQRDTETYYPIQRIHTLADGILDAAVASVFELRRPDTKPSQYWLDRWQKAIIGAVKTLAAADCGTIEAPHLGSLATISALGYLDFRHAELNWRQYNPQLALWYEPWIELPWVTITAPQE